MTKNNFAHEVNSFLNKCIWVWQGSEQLLVDMSTAEGHVN